ncbi:stabilizer of axonemal microtubules 2 [Denticeps clupeoides]|uniref:Stabilizer of axonemal microtubules 2 n=1 Tax=Denticeps clupeoides TaxID=299321 RepID=A0AAY4BG54_9TELE|nr:stabilizer of axonemal microtubules 2 [Denticeps clupeoides]
MTRRCICEICTCGRHRCPHQSTSLYGKGGKVCSVTEYSEKYSAYGGQSPPKTLKPKQEYQGNKARMDGNTTFKTDYVPHEVTSRPGRQQGEYRPEPGKIDLGTTYKQDFSSYEIQPVAHPRPKQRVRVESAKLDTLPTYKDDFRQWEIKRRQLLKKDLTYRPPSATFANLTSFQEEFVPKGLVPRENFKPSNVAKPSEAPFDGVTSNKLSYVAHPLEARFVKATAEYRPSSQPLQNMTTQRQDYQGLPGQTTKSCKPEYTKGQSEIPFKASTEFQDRFQQWPVALRQLRKSVEYESPMEPMDLNTTSQMVYIRHSVQPFVLAKPFQHQVRSSAPFQGNTTTKEDFKPWATHRTETIKKQKQLQQSSGKMESLTTFRAHYIPHELQPSSSLKPANTPIHKDVPMENTTMYRSEFTPRKIAVCPASFDSPPGYTFEESDELGHKFFRKSTTKTA